MFIEEIADLLEDNSIGTVGTDIFIGDLVIREDNGLYLINSPSPAPNEAIEIYEQVVDFWTRNSDSNTGYNVLKSVQNLLHKRSNYDLGDYRIYFSHNLGMIDDMDRDVEERKLYRLSMRFIYQPAIV